MEPPSGRGEAPPPLWYDENGGHAPQQETGNRPADRPSPSAYVPSRESDPAAPAPGMRAENVRGFTSFDWNAHQEGLFVPVDPQPMSPSGLFGVLSASLAGGILAAPIVFLLGLHHGVSFLAGPFLEEAVKPIGVIFLLEKRPFLLPSAGWVYALCLPGALLFAVAENLIYILVYHPGQSEYFAVFRWTVCTSLHLICTAIVAAGLSGALVRMRRERKNFSFDLARRHYFAAALVHLSYNGVALLLEGSHVLPF